MSSIFIINYYNDNVYYSLLQGIFISKVNPGGAADKAGVAVTDKLLSVSEDWLIN